ncbi:L-lactate dehydrogenase [Arcanobacterium wilhelmae]|uniref:L-lactate dehydrogenase n=1 Tax=Arcanobacterium wilhelmae TaxID=1803177 RepID=A0ABT9ND48_9ACTO|nr:hypothetical protein [Arcanobacterium wilhelmae]MDP9801572.1 L-lactate dehydrogenase [Arcanobacterium wilhelmae]WFN90899.1 hypothetical protein P8A24_03320 [Arcanobacterium wilhelmae]
MTPHKLVITGAGHVGSAVLTDAMKMGLFGEIAVIDTAPGVAYGEALDQYQAIGALTLTNVNVHEGTTADYTDADVVIVAAGPSMLPDPNDPTGKPDRAILAKVNSETIRQVMGDITAHTQTAAVIIITNPVDTLVWIAQNEFEYPEHLVWGTGTCLDSARLRRRVADHVGIAPASVAGFMGGEHGMAAFPILSHLTAGAVATADLPTTYGVDPLDPAEVGQAVVDAAYAVFNGKGWTNAGVAQAALSMARSYLLDEKTVFPGSTTLRAEWGHDGDVAMSFPLAIGAAGVEKRLPLTLNAWEEEAKERAAIAIQSAMTDADCNY